MTDIQHGGYTWRRAPEGGWWFWRGEEWVYWTPGAGFPDPPSAAAQPVRVQVVKQPKSGCAAAILLGLFLMLAFIIGTFAWCTSG